ncbi:hypothetical protein BASA50_004001 [Batrachochytrium salamandrivorans]|uniref:BAR domain-containing protein n=1 Tax=Batrachochytrium salamandrivorans TaxID=1357716 RepID=A0ABQ8FHE6_9FUNG|nr:hypothetical protein BASA62_000906 [Batrachochytrium salamandrivorans]KAH6598120.1 hypothetical protein BASA50_004001 [Batrachochytrium salamandrivorans]
MKFNALVIAAMVIASVNAGWKDGGKGLKKVDWKGSASDLFKKTGGMAKDFAKKTNDVTKDLVKKTGVVAKSTMERSPSLSDLSKLLQQGLNGRGFGGTSGGRGTSLGSICRIIFKEAHHLKKELAKLGHEFMDPMQALNSLEGVKSELTLDELQAHHASYNNFCTELQSINDRFTYLKGAYQGYLGVMYVGGCRNSYNRVDLPSEPTPLDAFIGSIELLDYKKKYGNEVIIPEEQEGDDSDLGASGWQ